jgi:hypothetical protein
METGGRNMAKPSFQIAFTGVKMTGIRNVVTTPIWYCNNTVYTHQFLSDNSNITS